MSHTSRLSNVTTNILVAAAGVVFLLAGAFKLLIVRAEFAAFLAEVHVPIPWLVATAVPAIEVCGGIALCFRRGTRIWAALLAADMFVAIVTVGLSGLFGRYHRVGSHTIGNEPWRLPLEICLFALMVWLVRQPRPAQAVNP